MKKYPLVTSIKIIKEHTIHEDNCIPLPFDTPYGNFKLKWIEILQRLDNVDTLIIQLFDEFELINKDKLLFDPKINELINKDPLFREKKDYFNHLKDLYNNLNSLFNKENPSFEDLIDLLNESNSSLKIEDGLKYRFYNDAIIDATIITQLFYRQKFLTEQILYWIRKTLDELISLLYVLGYYNENKVYPKKIKIESIGNFINSKQFMEEFKTKHLFFFNLINGISNTYKHSFINSDLFNHIGVDEPLTLSLSLKYNNLNNDPNLVCPKISNLLNYFDNLLVEIKDILIKLTTSS